MAKDTIDIVKADGSCVEGIKAVVSPRRIVTFNTDVAIEPKDVLVRRLADDEKEGFLVLDTIFNRTEDGVPENLQITVRRVELS
ncbi:hypothetical protein [Maridesulfovibrio sp.]|uniref:hypothetical protein n=1 Tax=Maridesulfovibrio sp. TaxID=2795000 RepID=UPI002A186D51|nr:hypothetical protein [Maridesulfovibrio sp.]